MCMRLSSQLNVTERKGAETVRIAAKICLGDSSHPTRLYRPGGTDDSVPNAPLVPFILSVSLAMCAFMRR